VIEELRAHLADRTEAIVADALRLRAERQAIREMGPGWLLALRLSAANGWNPLVHILRSLWAAGIGLEVAMGAALLLSGIAGLGRAASNDLPAIQLTYITPTYLLLLALLFAFGFAMGRVVRGWAWAIVPGLTLLWIARQMRGGDARTDLAAGATLLAALLIVTAGALGRRKASPKLGWLAWAAAGLVAVCMLAFGVVVAMVFGSAPTGAPIHNPIAALAAVARETAAMPETGLGWQWLAISWFCWLGAWAIERFGVAARPELAD